MEDNSNEHNGNIQERLQKYLARCNVASRRKCEEYIAQGRVSVNGKIVTELGSKINPEKDEVLFDDKKVKTENEKIYILLNKPIRICYNSRGSI